jgi:hypothetical protein
MTRYKSVAVPSIPEKYMITHTHTLYGTDKEEKTKKKLV